MKRKINFYIMCLFATIIFSNCSLAHNYNFSLKDTLAIFLLKNENNYYFCIPIQYLGDFQIESFEFINGNILIGDYEILLNREEINISMYLNEEADDYNYSDGQFNLIYLEENSRISTSKMSEPLTIKNDDEKMNHYYIFIVKYLSKADVKKIIKEYKKGNVYSNFCIWYDITIDNEKQTGSGLLDDFELYDGLAFDPAWFPQNLDFFKTKYLQK